MTISHHTTSELVIELMLGESLSWEKQNSGQHCHHYWETTENRAMNWCCICHCPKCVRNWRVCGGLGPLASEFIAVYPSGVPNDRTGANWTMQHAAVFDTNPELCSWSVTWKVTFLTVTLKGAELISVFLAFLSNEKKTCFYWWWNCANILSQSLKTSIVSNCKIGFTQGKRINPS